MDYYTGCNLQYFYGKNFGVIARHIFVENIKFET